MNIFLSYNSKDRPAVEIIAADLKELGYTVWFDRELSGGHEWWAAILESIRQCDVFVIAITQKSLDSIPCQRERNYAHALQKRILPILLEDVDIRLLPTALQLLQFVDYRQRSTETALKLGRALHLLPPAENLPDPLPAEPETPLSDFAVLSAQISVPSMTIDEQQRVVLRLRELLLDEDNLKPVQTLLERLLARPDLFAKVGREIETLLNLPAPTVKASKSVKSAGVASGDSDSKALVLSDQDLDIYRVKFIPDGRQLVTCGRSGSIDLWDLETLKCTRKITTDINVDGLDISPDGKYVLAHAMLATKAEVYAIESGKMAFAVKGHKGLTSVVVRCVRFAQDGKTFITCADDKRAILWDTTTGQMIRRFEKHHDFVFFADFSPDGSKLVSCTGRFVYVWDVNSGQRLMTIRSDTDGVQQVWFLQDGCTVVAVGKALNLWDSETGTKIVQLGGNTGNIECAALSPDGRLLLTGGTDQAAHLWNIETRTEIRRLGGRPKKVKDVAFSPDGTSAIVAYGDKIAHLWQITD